jgi:hypothetical protein
VCVYMCMYGRTCVCAKALLPERIYVCKLTYVCVYAQMYVLYSSMCKKVNLPYNRPRGEVEV